MRIGLVDQIDFPLPVPVLELLFAHDRRFHFAEQLEMNEAVNGVLRSESWQRVIAMLLDATEEIGGNADVERAVGLARKDVDAGLALILHEPEFAAQWVLKQVQDDEFGSMWILQ